MNNKEINWTEIVNLAGQMHNRLQDPYMPLDEQEQNETTEKILALLHLNTSELLAKVADIECAFDELCNGMPLDNYRKGAITQACYELRRIITETIGE